MSEPKNTNFNKDVKELSTQLYTHQLAKISGPCYDEEEGGVTEFLRGK